MAVVGGGFQVGPQRQDPWQDTAKNLIGAYQAFKTAKEMEKESMLAQKKLDWEKQSAQIKNTFDVLDKVAGMLDGGWAQLATEAPESLSGLFEATGVPRGSARTFVDEMSKASPGWMESTKVAMNAAIRKYYTTGMEGAPPDSSDIASTITKQVDAAIKEREQKAKEAAAAAATPTTSTTAPTPAAPAPEHKVLPIPAVGTMSPAAQAATRSPGPIYNYVGGGFNRGAVFPSPAPPPASPLKPEDIVGQGSPKTLTTPAADHVVKVDEEMARLQALRGDVDNWLKTGKSTPALDTELGKLGALAKKERKLMASRPVSKRFTQEEIDVMTDNLEHIMDRDAVAMAFGGAELVVGKVGAEAKAEAARINSQAELLKAMTAAGKDSLEWQKFALQTRLAESLMGYRDFLKEAGFGKGGISQQGKMFSDLLKRVTAKSTPESMGRDIARAVKDNPPLGAWIDSQVEALAKANNLKTTTMTEFFNNKVGLRSFARAWFWIWNKKPEELGPEWQYLWTPVTTKTISGMQPGAVSEAVVGTTQEAAPAVAGDQAALFQQAMQDLINQP